MINLSNNSGGDNSSGSIRQRQNNSVKRRMVFESVRSKRQLRIETADGVSVETFSHWVNRVTFATESGREITLPSITRMDLFHETN